MNKVYRVLSSGVLGIVLMIVYAFVLGVATFIEKDSGTLAAKRLVYNNPLFFIYQLLMVLNFALYAVEHYNLKAIVKRLPMFMIHLAFIVILAGAAITFYFGEEGFMHIREGESTNQITIYGEDTREIKAVPFEVELKDFTLRRYPGSSSPSSYESSVIIHGDDDNAIEALIYMNNVLDYKGYRFFQSSYDQDECGTVLTVSHDVVGKSVTYVGYFLLFVGLILSFLWKHSRFMHLVVSLKLLREGFAKSMFVSLLILFYTIPLSANSKVNGALNMLERYQISQEHAAKFGALPMQSYDGRMMPVNTFTSQIMRKIYKEKEYIISDECIYNSDQAVISMMIMPDVWSIIPFIDIPSGDIAKFLGVDGDKCSFADLFDEQGNYRLAARVDEAYAHMAADRTKFDKDLIKLDERANMLNQILSGKMLRLFPLEGDSNNSWYAAGDDLSKFTGKDSMFVSKVLYLYADELVSSLQSGDWSGADKVIDMIHTYSEAKSASGLVNDKKIEMELNYNRAQIFERIKFVYLIVGLLILVASFVMMFKQSALLKYSIWILASVVVVAALFQVIGLAMRWYVGGYAPWSNSYETMVLVSLITICGGVIFVRKSPVTFALATMFSGMILLVSGMNWMDPEISPLVPVLKSPWLMFHVAVIMAAYGFFGISTLLGITNLALLSSVNRQNSRVFAFRVNELTTICEMSILLGLALMTIGTFLGAIWANESWGRYWGWDPKETWALITIIIYAIVSHLHIMKSRSYVWSFNLFAVLAFASVLMTYFGVNYFLSGMHSYGQSGSINEKFYLYLYVTMAMVVLLAILSKRGFNRLMRFSNESN